MRLEVGSFKVKDIVFGDKTAYSGGILTVDKEDALRVVRGPDDLPDLQLAQALDYERAEYHTQQERGYRGAGGPERYVLEDVETEEQVP